MTNEKKERRGLGRGLSALMADANLNDAAATSSARSQGARFVPVDHVVPNPDQPRRDFNQRELEGLAESIRQKGVIQPLIVRPVPDQEARYQIVAGERRWRAAQLAQVHDIPVVVRNLDDLEVLEIAIIENIQREDLNAIEEALGYRQLMDRFGHTQDKVAEALGRSRSHIANMLRLLTLPDEVQNHVRQGRLSAGHARALITAGNPVALATRVIAEELSVRETERMAKLVQPSRPGRPDRPGKATEKDADTRALEGDLSSTLGMKVTISHSHGSEHGQLIIQYRDLEQLDTLCQRLSGFS